jgi:hypothetical protein
MTIHELIEERKEIDRSSDYEKLKQIRESKQNFVLKRRELKEEVAQKYKEKRRLIEDFAKSQKDYERIQEELESQKSVIFANAKQMTLNERNEHRKIKAANSLIAFVQRLNQMTESRDITISSISPIAKHKALQ